MKSRWFITLFAAVPLAAAVLVLQSCGGEGGPLTGGAGGTSPSQQFLALLTAEQRAGTYVGTDTCAAAACHGGRAEDDPIYTHWLETKHATKNVGCESCHGPGSVHAASPSKDNILTFPKSADTVVCAQCHGPTHEQYLVSKHRQLVSSPVQGTVTNPASYGRNSRCIACHGGLFRVQTYERGIDPVDMTDDEIRNIAQDVITYVPQTALCVTCHDPHAITGNLTANGKEVQLRHKTFNVDTTQVGPSTAAAVFTKFDHICAQCHNGRGTDPSDAKLTSGTSRPSMHDSNQFNMLLGFGGVEGDGPVDRNTAHANAPGQCSKCHMPEARHSFTVSYNACAPCHTENDAAARVTSVKNDILGSLYSLRVRMANWAFATLGDELFWEYTSNITAENKTPPNQSLVPIQVKRARHNYYFVVRSGDYGVHNSAYARHLIRIANDNMDQLTGGLNIPVHGGLTIQQKLAIIERDRKKASEADMTAGGDF